MAQAGLELTTSCLLEWSLSEFCHTDSCFLSVEIRIYKDKPFFIYGARSLLSCCTVLGVFQGRELKKYCNIIYVMKYYQVILLILLGIVVSALAFHDEGRGSITRLGKLSN